ncbi:hypothetical protein IMZ48_31930 [Candidatus Bathyarchaeota archaeon]|nr:hypothetical protein [Candidatus Bathyarchaeota archaeon]
MPVLFKPPSGLSQIDKFQFLELVPRSGSGETLSSILRNYRLTPKNKVILAYTIAQAYWQFYDSELMRTKWTSETICFMSADVRGASPPDEMPLRPYLTFPFGIPSNPLQDVIHDDHLNHQHPRIFAIGVLLLGIGLAEPFPTISRRNQVSQVNGDHQIATNQLRELKTAKWDGFRYKSYFDSAVEHCLDGQRLVSRSEKPIKAGAAGPMLSTTRPDEQDGILRRRKSFYNNVVLPLKWLAEKGFGHGYQVIPCIRRNPAVPSPSAGILASLPQLEASFHSGRDVNPRMWLRDLNTISSEVERERRVYRAKRDGDVGTEFEVRTTAIRIAILDTGLDRSLLGFDLEDGRPSRVTREKDFVDGSSTADTFGHGTFMARLVMKCAPSAEIIVARVARDSEQLKVSQERVKEVS